jgi:hypothetical protein
LSLIPHLAIAMPFLRLVSTMFLALMVASLAALEPAPDNSSYSQQKQAYALPSVATKLTLPGTISHDASAPTAVVSLAANEPRRAGKVPFMGQNVPGAGQ